MKETSDKKSSEMTTGDVSHMPSARSDSHNLEPVKLCDWIGKHAPRFGISGESIEVINTPEQFYNTLMEKAKTSKRRIILSSLYLGTGHLEKKLVNSIKEAVIETSKDEHPVDVHILLDFTRGSRDDVNSRTMLLPLVREFGDNVQISLYHTPNLRGFWKKVLPDRWNEVVGLQHMKIYIFDDDLIISGANLSDSYFTNRQDRYVLFQEVPCLADYYGRLVKCVSSMSFQLDKHNTLKLHQSNDLHPFDNKDNGKAYKEEFHRRVTAAMKQNMDAQEDCCARTLNDPQLTSSQTKNKCHSEFLSNSKSNTLIDTWVYPLVQMGQIGIFNDDIVTNQFFQRAIVGSNLFLASGYFNLTDNYMDVIVNHSKANFNIVTAAPEANGFFGAKGVSGGIPAAYTQYTKALFSSIHQKCAHHRIKIFEYARPGWTFHGKGLWYYLPGESLPCVTCIGSPNYGYRSVYRDLEAQMIVVTSNQRLKQQLHKEQISLFSKATTVSKNTFTMTSRTVPLWVKGITKLIRSFM